MNDLVMFYSLTGRTHYEAKRLAEELGAELYEVREQRRRSLVSAYLFGAHQARRRAYVLTEPLALRLEEYDRIVLMSPVWGGYPAPAFNAMVRELPAGREVRVILTSDSGTAKELDALKERVERQGVRVSKVEVIKTEDLKKRDRKHMKRMKEKDRG